MEYGDGKDKLVRETKLKRKNVKTKGKFPKNTRINLEKLYFYRRNVKKGNYSAIGHGGVSSLK